MTMLHDIASLFRPGKRRARDTRFAPGLEQLGERLVPALLAPPTVINGTLTVLTDGGGDTVSFIDRGWGSVRMESQARVQGVTYRFDRDYAGVSTIRMVDLGGTNTVTYNAANAFGRTVAEMEYTGGSGIDRFTANVLNGLAANNRLLIDVVGGAGDDILHVMVGGRLLGGSSLDVAMDGQLGWDSVGVNAWTHAPTIDAGARLSATVAGYNASQLENTPDAGNNVSFYYLGQMNGTLSFNVLGSSGHDWTAANVWVNGGSTGTIADGVVRGGGGNDSVDYIIRGDASLRFSGRHEADGGTGFDQLTLARYGRAPNLFFNGIYSIDTPFLYDTDL